MRKSLINRRAAKAADSMYRRSGMFARLEKSPVSVPKASMRNPQEPSGKAQPQCLDYMEEKDNPYPLCDNPACPLKHTCCLSAHMDGPHDNR